MKASIKLDTSTAPATLRGKLGIANVPYTATLEIEKPDGQIDRMVVPSSQTDDWAVSLGNYSSGNYKARIVPREVGAFEGTLLLFTL